MADPVTTLAWLVLAHFVADFVLQTDRMAADKNADGGRALSGLARHVGAVAVCLAPVIAAFGLSGAWYLVLTTATHGLIDRAKILATRRAEVAAGGASSSPSSAPEAAPIGPRWSPLPGAYFVLDQLAHLALVFVLWAVLLSTAPLTVGWESAVGRITARWDPVMFGEAMLWIAVLMSLVIVNVRAASFFVATLVGPGPAAADGGPGAAPDRIGETIGVLERILIVIFVLGGAAVAVGLVIAAKTIARFRQLDDRAFAEYYLLGTLASVSVAVVSALLAAAALGA